LVVSRAAHPRAPRRTENLLAAAAAAAGVFLVLVVATRRKYPSELEVVDTAPAESERPTLRVLSSHRFIMLIVAFQMLSAVESQCLISSSSIARLSVTPAATNSLGSSAVSR